MKTFFKYKSASSLLQGGLTNHFFVAAALVLSLFFSSDADARLNGEASLVYSRYNGSAQNSPGQRSSMSTSYLNHSYSLMYSSNGVLYNSRIGNYDVALGYSLTSIDSSLKATSEQTENTKITRGHLMYSGEVNLNPKEVPFKLHAYSRDLSQPIATSLSSSGGLNIGSIIFGSDVPNNINSGVMIESGATLIAGVKNGMTNGFNEYLRHFPMLLVDFKDTIYRDYRSVTPVNDRLTRLAFVSLNKKDNWLHYRHLRYQNNINPEKNYDENEIQLGTIDQHLTRRWIEFSNWIKVSTDMEITKRKTVDRVNPTEEINLNMFVAAERAKWSAATFSSFNRFVDSAKNISAQTSLPLYVSGSVDKDLSWNARISFRDNQDIDISGDRQNYTNMLVGYSLNAFKNSLFLLDQGIDVESSATNSSDNLTLSGSIGLNSSPLFSRIFSVGASYSIRNTTNSFSDGLTSEFLLQTLDLHGGYVLNNTLRFDLSQKNMFTQGNYVALNDAPNNSQTPLFQYDDQTRLTSDQLGSESYQSSSSLSASWTPKPRLNVGFSLNEEITKTAELPVTMLTGFTSNISFAASAWNMNNSFGYSRDNHNNSSFSEGLKLNYSHSRSLNANVSASYGTNDSNESHIKMTTFSQGLNYSCLTTSGSARKLFELYENMSRSVTSSKLGAAQSKSTASNAFNLGFRYFPITRLTFTGGLGYSYSTSMSEYSLVWNVSAAANFKLLQASLDYVSAFRPTDKLRENKLTGNIRKTF